MRKVLHTTLQDIDNGYPNQHLTNSFESEQRSTLSYSTNQRDVSNCHHFSSYLCSCLWPCKQRHTFPRRSSRSYRIYPSRSSFLSSSPSSSRGRLAVAVHRNVIKISVSHLSITIHSLPHSSTPDERLRSITDSVAECQGAMRHPFVAKRGNEARGQIKKLRYR